MRYAEGARLFFRALSTRLLFEGDIRGPVQLVAPLEASLPGEDQLLLAAALATRLRADAIDAMVIQGCDLKHSTLQDGPAVVDCRELAYNDVIQCVTPKIVGRPDIVLLVNAHFAGTGCRSVLFSRNSEVLFKAVTESLKYLSDHIGYDGPRMEMPIRYLSGGFSGIQSTFKIFHDENLVFNRDYLENFTETVSSGWIYAGRKVQASTLLTWIKQFETYGVIAEAVALLEYLDRHGFIPKGEIINRLTSIYEEIVQEEKARPAVCSIQKAGKSESMILYELRDYKKTSLADHILSGIKDQHIVCFDDVVGSGDTIRDCLFEGVGTVAPGDTERWLAAAEARRVTVVCAVASQSGKEAVESDPRGKGRVRIRASRILREEDKILTNREGIFKDNSSREKFRQVCLEIGSELCPTYPVGWGECEWAIVTDYNVPDCSLPVIWCGGGNWEPLFPRR